MDSEDTRKGDDFVSPHHGKSKPQGFEPLFGTAFHHFALAGLSLSHHQISISTSRNYYDRQHTAG
jgi:hypothetical protein